MCYVCNEHNTPTEIHAFLKRSRSEVATPYGAVKNGANDPPRPTTQPFYGLEQRLCTLLYVTLKDRSTSIQDLSFLTTPDKYFLIFIQIGEWCVCIYTYILHIEIILIM